ncbi:hypothetical protein GKN94_11355 [Candidatus Lucifugimonas marina]|uniref:hypothetical protein n=1 Tax=Candidatus Lucifugimonas marina TaxID=3038979 RepID=UPI0027996C81|nr:hypothetical protein GKN94_11355 [SAR202 cluster bacterium JH545]
MLYEFTAVYSNPMRQLNMPLSTKDRLTPAYSELNEAVGREIFSVDNQFKPVYIDLENDILKRIVGAKQSAKKAEQALVSTVKDNLILDRSEGHTFQKFNRAISGWITRDPDGLPPHLGLLAVFSRVAQNMGSKDGLSTANFYMRLERLFGQKFDSKIRHHYPDVARRYYGLLNRWLERQDHRYGVPTAYSFDSRVHVGLPISQSLLREADRSKLHELFETYDLRPNETMSRTDMGRLIDGWIRSSTINKYVKGLWSSDRAAARERISTVASLELSTWSGPKRRRSGKSHSIQRDSKKLLLAGSIGGFPESRLNLQLVTTVERGIAIDRFAPANDQPNGAENIVLASVGGNLDVAQNTIGDYVELTNSNRLDYSAVLAVPMSLRSSSGVSAVWIPRRLAILRRDPAMPGRYVQATRADLGVRSIVICAEQLSDYVEQFLEKVARPGFNRYNATSLPGCPSGWEVFDGVIIQDLADPRHLDLGPLAPELHRTKISFDGGLRLSAGNRAVWHFSEPPEVLISAHNTADAAYEILFQPRDMESETTVTLITKTQFTSSTSLEIPSIESAGDVIVNLYQPSDAANASESRSLTLITGSNPSPYSTDPKIVYRIIGPNALLSPETFVRTPKAPHLQGNALFHADAITVKSDWIEADLNLITDNGSVDPERSARNQSTQMISTRESIQPINIDDHFKADCFITGSHVTKLPTEHNTPGSGRGSILKNVLGECESCGAKKIHRQWPDHWGGRNGRQKGGLLSGPVTPMLTLNKQPISDWNPAQIDHVLDSLAYLNFGGWNAFQRLALQIIPDRFFPNEFAHTLEALGHVDFTRDYEMRQSNWSVAPSVCVLSADRNSGILTGRRTMAMMARLKAAEENGDCMVSFADQGPGIPIQVTVSWADADDPPSVLTAGWMMAEGIDIATQVLSGLTGVRAASALLPEGSIGAGAAARHYSLETNKWVDAIYDPKLTGAYQFLGHRGRYGFNDGNRLVYTDHRTAKHLAANLEGYRLISYDVQTQELTVPLGAELPGLLDRIACLASGQTAKTHRLRPWTKVYAGADPIAAAGIFHCLYGESN